MASHLMDMNRVGEDRTVFIYLLVVATNYWYHLEEQVFWLVQGADLVEEGMPASGEPKTTTNPNISPQCCTLLVQCYHHQTSQSRQSFYIMNVFGPRTSLWTCETTCLALTSVASTAFLVTDYLKYGFEVQPLLPMHRVIILGSLRKAVVNLATRVSLW